MDRKVTWKRERLLKSIDNRQMCSAQAEQLSMNNQYLNRQWRVTVWREPSHVL